MARIKTYDFRRTKQGRKLIIWQPAGRGSKVKLAAVVGGSEITNEQLMALAVSTGHIPDRLVRGDLRKNLPLKPTI